jgi:hypothetical protein
MRILSIKPERLYKHKESRDKEVSYEYPKSTWFASTYLLQKKVSEKGT